MARRRTTAIAVALILTVAAIGSVMARSSGATDVSSATTPSTTTVASVPPEESPAKNVDKATKTVERVDETADTQDNKDPSDVKGAVDGNEPGRAPADPDLNPETRPDLPTAPVRDVISGAGTPPRPVGPTELIGELGDDLPVPDGFDLVAPSKQGGPPNGLGGPGDLAPAPSCSYQCITSGVAYPRGFGVELVVETTVPTKLFMTVIADLDNDGNYEESYLETTPFGATGYSWTIDHLTPGATYYVMAAATDENDNTSYVWGEFTTLSQRDVFVEFGDLEISGGPGNVTSTQWLLGLDGPPTNVTPGQQGILIYKDIPRFINLDFWVVRSWQDDLCEAWSRSDDIPQGGGAAVCRAWNSGSIDVDLDVAPAGKTRWTSTTVQRTLRPATGEGNALPPGYGDPYWFDFEVPITLYVTYS